MNAMTVSPEAQWPCGRTESKIGSTCGNSQCFYICLWRRQLTSRGTNRELGNSWLEIRGLPAMRVGEAQGNARWMRYPVASSFSPAKSLGKHQTATSAPSFRLRRAYQAPSRSHLARKERGRWLEPWPPPAPTRGITHHSQCGRAPSRPIQTGAPATTN